MTPTFMSRTPTQAHRRFALTLKVAFIRIDFADLDRPAVDHPQRWAIEHVRPPASFAVYRLDRTA